MGVSNYYRDIIMDTIMQRDALTLPAVYYISLCLTEPSATDTDITSDEVIYSNYVRQALSVTAGFGDAVNGSSANLLAVTFPTVGATGSTSIGYWAICDASSTGNLLWWGAITTPSVLVTDDVPIMNIGDIVLSIS